MTPESLVRRLSALVVVGALVWLVDNVNAHGNHIAADFDTYLKANSLQAAPVRAQGFDAMPDTAGFDLIDMYDCGWGPTLPDIGGRVGLWLVTAVVGGIPTAILIRRN